MFLNDYGARWYNPQLNQWHQIDPLAENYYALSSYNYVANNPIKYIDPDGREFIGEFDTYRTSIEEEGLTSGEVPGCPECDPIGMLQEVLITATRLIGPQTLEEQLAYLEETKEIREENQNTMYPLPQATGSLDVANDELNLIPYERIFTGALKLVAAAVPFIIRVGKNVKETRIKIDEANKIDRELLNPPNKPGNAPTFKKDGKKVEIHHQGQKKDGPFKEMHPDDHRGKGNNSINHPNKGQKSEIDRKEFNKARQEYWKNEFPPQ